MLMSDPNMWAIVHDRWIDWFINNTKWIIKRYSKYKWHKQNERIIKKYSLLLKRLNEIKIEIETEDTDE